MDFLSAARDLAQQQRNARDATHAIGTRHVLNIANDVVNDSELVHFFLRRSRYDYLLATELDFDCAFQSVLAEAGELLLVFDHR